MPIPLCFFPVRSRAWMVHISEGHGFSHAPRSPQNETALAAEEFPQWLKPITSNLRNDTAEAMSPRKHSRTQSSDCLEPRPSPARARFLSGLLELRGIR